MVVAVILPIAACDKVMVAPPEFAVTLVPAGNAVLVGALISWPATMAALLADNVTMLLPIVAAAATVP